MSGGGADQEGSRARGIHPASRSAAGLNPKQRRFVSEYLKDCNGTQAAIRAGYSKKTAASQASTLLRNPKVSALVGQKVQKLEERDFLKVLDLERELARLINFDPAKLVGPDGKPLALQDLDEDTRRALCGVDVEELFEGRGGDRAMVGLIRKVRWHDKRAAIDLAMRRRGALTEKVELSGSVAVEHREITDEEWAAMSVLIHKVRDE